MLHSMLPLLLTQPTLAGGGGAGSSWQDGMLFWIPLLLLILIYSIPKVYSLLKAKFKKHVAEEPKQQ